ncbi:MAG: hypothetical protein KF819_32315 [Labilithrix sp.]|nr:hypothetical protein [Labilithrix sp.]
MRPRSILFVVSLAAIAPAACSKSEPPDEGETFASAIEPIVREKCQTCHREGGIAPFGLMTYEDVSARGEIARDAIARRAMPPWGPRDDEACANVHPFKGDMSLTQAQIDTFARWVDRGMPRGDTSKVPPRAIFSPIGLADKTHAFELAAPYTVPAKAKDELRCFPIDPGFTEDTWIGESILIPGDPRVLHHALVYLDPEREGVTKMDESGSYPCFGAAELKKASLLLAWSPGGTSTTYGENAGLEIPKGAHLVTQMHYHPIETAATGRASLELKKLAERPAHAATFILLGNADGKSARPKLLPGPNDPASGPEFFIPGGAKDHVEAMDYENPGAPLRLAAVGAHMHWAGVGMKVEVEHAAKGLRAPKTDCLLNTTYDFNWQRTYAYDVPLDQAPIFGRGDKLRITCTYDNTEENPLIARSMRERRMTKPPAIKLGSKSTDEMCQAILVFVE